MSYRLSALRGDSLPSLIEGIGEVKDWQERRERIYTVWKQYIGEMPNRAAPDLQLLSQSKESDHVRLHITYRTGFGDRATAFLLIPGSDPKPAARRPAVLALHPTHPSGKSDVASPLARQNRGYGLELVSRGFVVLAPDAITAGERIYEGKEAYQSGPFYEKFPRSTTVGKMLHDHQQALDALQQLSYVDAHRIGAIGHSLGAYNAIFLAGWDRRVKAVVSSCGLSPFADDPDPGRWGQRDWFSHIPRLSQDLRNDEVPFEMHEIAALCAPTPLFNWMGQNDPIFPHWTSIASASQEIHRLYERLGIQHHYVGLLGNEGHDFPMYIRRLAYRFLEQWLNNDSKGFTTFD